MSRKVSLVPERRRESKWAVRWSGEFDPANGKRKRHSKAFRTKREAERFQAAKQVELDRGDAPASLAPITLAQYCEDYQRRRAHEWSPSTKCHVRQVCDRLVAYFGPDTPLQDISVHRAADFWSAASKQREGYEGEELSRSTRNWLLRYAKTMFSYAVRWGHIRSNPFAEISALRTGKSTRRDWHYITPEEYRCFLEVAPSMRWRVFYAIAYTSGARSGELFNLTIDNVDFDQGRLLIRNRVASPDVPPFQIKDHEGRDIPLPQHTIELVQRWCEERPGGSRFLLLSPERYARVQKRWHACRANGAPWLNRYMANNVIRSIRLHAKKAGIEPTAPLTIHAFRKSCGQNWANHLPMHLAQVFMGHADIATTAEFYSKVTADDVRRAQRVAESVVNERCGNGIPLRLGFATDVLAV